MSVEAKEHTRNEPPVKELVAMVQAVLERSIKERSYSELTLKIVFKDGWPGDLIVAEQSSHKFFRRPQAQ